MSMPGAKGEVEEMKGRALLGLLLALPLMACAGSKAPETPRPAAADEPCPFVYVYAPGNYIIDIAGGAEVVLDPAAQEFELFCAPGEARAAVDAAVAKGDLPAGDWRIYRLDGTLDDLAQQSGPKRYLLRRMAQVVDWATENI